MDDAGYETTNLLADSVEGKHGRVKTSCRHPSPKSTGKQGRVKTAGRPMCWWGNMV